MLKSVIINQKIRSVGIPSELLSMLPDKISQAVNEAMPWLFGKRCEEIRLRCERPSTLTVSGNITFPLEISLSRDEMDYIVDKLCGGSLYAHGDTIKNGYIVLPDGLRAGVCGHAAVENGNVFGVRDITSLCIRIPHRVSVDPSTVCVLLEEMSYSRGVLIFSAPGEGKTTLLRAATAELSRLDRKKPLRVAVIDTRGELEFGLSGKSITAEILSGYPKDKGIEIALRTLNANIIVCDEIGGEAEARAICDASNGGAALLASAHADNITSLLAKKSIRILHDAGVFGAYVGIKRLGDAYEWSVYRSGEVGL